MHNILYTFKHTDSLFFDKKKNKPFRKLHQHQTSRIN